MKKKKGLLLIVLLLVFAMILPGCGEKKDNNGKDGEVLSKSAEIPIGTWNENTFENSWINMKFEKPADWLIATKEEINALLGVGAKAMAEATGVDGDAMKVAADAKLTYAFMTSTPATDVNVQLFFENLSLMIGGSKLNEEAYIDLLLDTILLQKEIGYVVVEEDTLELAGKTFYRVKLSGYNGAMFSEYLCYKKDNYMVSLVSTYAAGNEEVVNTFINSIEAIK